MPTTVKGQAIDASLKDGDPSQPTMRSLGTGAQQAAAGNDPRFGGGSGLMQWMETPSGAIDGVNATFTLAQTPAPAGALMLFLNGILQRQGGGNDYTLAGSTVTFNTPPPAGDTLVATYPY